MIATGENDWEDGEWNNMDSYDWVNYIDEYHCADYWYDLDSLMDDGCFEDDFYDNDEQESE